MRRQQSNRWAGLVEEWGIGFYLWLRVRAFRVYRSLTTFHLSCACCLSIRTPTHLQNPLQYNFTKLICWERNEISTEEYVRILLLSVCLYLTKSVRQVFRTDAFEGNGHARLHASMWSLVDLIISINLATTMRENYSQTDQQEKKILLWSDGNWCSARTFQESGYCLTKIQ